MRKITCSISMLKKSNGAARTLRLETGRMARQADGAVLATYGETTVLATAVAARIGKARDRFLPAHRQLPGKDLCRRQDSRRLFQARRPSDRARDADLAPHRPADPAAVRRGFRNETQVIATVLSYDLENDCDIVAMVAASAALTLSGIPFMGPIGGGARRRRRRRICAQSDDRADEDLRARSRRRRHPGRGADGRIGSEGAVRREDARRRHVRPPHFQPVIEAIIRLAERSARQPRDFTPPDRGDAVQRR